VDSLDIHPANNNVIVISNRQFYELPLYHDGTLLSICEIQVQLQCILDDSTSVATPLVSPGVFTAWDRTKYFKIREAMLKEPENRDIIKRINNAAFVVVLDKARPNDVNEAMRELACGDVDNRWFDKMFQIIFFANGRAGGNGEHTPLDAPAFAAGIDLSLELMRKQNQQGYPLLSPPRSLPFPTKLNWTLASEVIQAGIQARKDAETLKSDLDLEVLHFHTYGVSWIKSKKLSPDGYIQMALHLTFYKIHGKGCPTYESAQTRQFLHGRTSTVRTFSEASVAFTKGMCSDISNEEKIKLLHIGLKEHRDYMLDCVNGKDVDRHLLGLRILAMEEGLKLPIFTDKTYSASSYYLLSTSNVPSKTFTGSFGQMYPEGYGMPYSPRDDMLIICVVSSKSYPHSSSKKFVQVLDQSLKEMAAIFQPLPISKL